MKRTADKLLTSISHDGVRWIETASLTAGLPERVSVGVEAISNSDREFVVEFDDFKVVSERFDRPAGERLTSYGTP